MHEDSFKIGKIKLNSRIILAPMAGITDLVFRMLNRRFGCDTAFVEMINVRSLGYKSKKTIRMLSTNSEDRPLGVQILGCEPEFILRGMDIISSHQFDMLDFNAACPERKVTRRGEGASLLKDPDKLGRLLKLVVSNTDKPVTVKIRTGWDKEHINAREVALKAQDSGVKAVFIHGRTKQDGYSGSVDYRPIREVKKALDIPVIASGDVFSAHLAKKMFEETGCDGVLVARGALGNPWIFAQIKGFLSSSQIKPLPTSEEIRDVMLEHLRANMDFHGPKMGVVIFRKFFIWYTRGFKNIRTLRSKAFEAKDKDAITAVIDEFCTRNRNRRPAACHKLLKV